MRCFNCGKSRPKFFSNSNFFCDEKCFNDYNFKLEIRKLIVKRQEMFRTG